MDDKMIENIMSRLQVLIENQRRLETKVDTIEEKFEEIQNRITENWNQVGHLESDHLRVSDHIKEIDLKLNDFDKMINETVRRIKDLEVENKKLAVSKSQCNECTECGKVFENKTYLRQHVKRRHSIPVACERSKSQSNECTECGKVFENKTYLRQHVKRRHSIPVTCEICGESFDNSCKLEKHLKNHSEASVFSCSTCGKTFYMRWRLNKHMALHNETDLKHCHYYNNRKDCPFEDIGCKFAHKFSEECKFSSKCREYLCPFQHQERSSIRLQI